MAVGEEGGGVSSLFGFEEDVRSSVLGVGEEVDRGLDLGRRKG